MKLNSVYFSQEIEAWDAEAIEERLMWLTDRVLEIWPTFETRRTEVETTGSRKAAPSMPAPAAIIICSERLETKTVRDVMRQAARYVGTLGVNFVSLSSQMPNLIKQTPFATSNYDWGNSWYLNIHWDSQRTLEYTTLLLKFAGVGEDEWHLEKKAL